MTLKEYYGSYKSLLGILSGLVAISPVVSLIPSDITSRLFPPLGPIDAPARVFALIAALLTTYVVYFEKVRNHTRAIVISAAMFFILASAYLAINTAVVRTMTISSTQPPITVPISIGFHRTDFAQQTFPGASDEEILLARGFTDDKEIRHCWTLGSILLARGLLWCTWAGALISLVACFAFGIIVTKGEGLSTSQNTPLNCAQP